MSDITNMAYKIIQWNHWENVTYFQWWIDRKIEYDVDFKITAITNEMTITGRREK